MTTTYRIVAGFDGSDGGNTFPCPDLVPSGVSRAGRIRADALSSWPSRRSCPARSTGG
jgi:hypothetical protein